MTGSIDEALERIAALEVTVETLSMIAQAAFQAGWETGLRRGRNGAPDSTPPPPGRHLRAV